MFIVDKGVGLLGRLLQLVSQVLFLHMVWVLSVCIFNLHLAEKYAERGYGDRSKTKEIRVMRVGWGKPTLEEVVREGISKEVTTTQIS